MTKKDARKKAAEKESKVGSKTGGDRSSRKRTVQKRTAPAGRSVKEDKGRQESEQGPAHQGEVVVPPKTLARMEDQLPTAVFVLPVEQNVLFPGLILPLALEDKKDLATLEQAKSQSSFIGVVAIRPKPSRTDSLIVLPDRPEPDSFFDIGSVGRIVQIVNLPEGKVGVMVMGLQRMRITSWLRLDPVRIAQVDYPDEVLRDARESEALERQVRQAFGELVASRPDLADELARVSQSVEGPARLTDFVAANLGLSLEDRQGLLATFEIDARLRRVLAYLEKELDLARLGQKVRQEIREKVERQQREYYLREQLKTIRQELGEEVDEKQVELEEYERRIVEAQMPPEAEKRARYELRRLKILPQEAGEYHVIRTYLDWLVSLPWSRSTQDNDDVSRAEAILEKDHYGLEEVKARIVEFLAVRKLKPDQGGAILCLVGPPGVGKTSLGQSVARAMGRRFHRVSLGGMRDEAEIKGHRRTYVGALPGRILQGLKRVGTNNPVFMLDEIDKLASDWRGDPASALLEVLDPAQNHAFEDNYLEVPFDLSHVMFIATANYAGQIPKPLYDRMEIIEIPGYIPDEKIKIASRYLVPRQIEAHGLGRGTLKMGQTTLREIVSGYTRESGVRELDRQVARICRKIAAGIATGRRSVDDKVVVSVEDVEEYLGKRRYYEDEQVRVGRHGVAVGLAWTPFGGDVLFIEVASMPGNGKVQVTGKLGEVMNESARIAVSVVRANAERWGIPTEIFRTQDLHIHVPAGAVPKDGPSAGITLTTALVSLLGCDGRGIKVLSRLAMTGELTLRGVVLPVGGIREKMVAAKRSGIRTVILPGGNRSDIEELPDRVRRGMKFLFVDEIEEVLRAALPVRFGKALDRRLGIEEDE